ncbi:hypothetical protein BCR42DRAFT_370755 [Absidia repens]|uniref:Uncharacterized protein n=1 Tax=Absidia repens TaxID=90262 RepID=A0A1X2IRD2_9FUNG|nr:hypothetical protein BCR42DRAFT_370755 [Absidia repens]
MGNETSRPTLDNTNYESTQRPSARHERKRNSRNNSLRRIKGKSSRSVLDPSILPFDTTLPITTPSPTPPPPPLALAASTSPPLQQVAANTTNTNFGSAPGSCETERGPNDPVLALSHSGFTQQQMIPSSSSEASIFPNQQQQQPSTKISGAAATALSTSSTSPPPAAKRKAKHSTRSIMTPPATSASSSSTFSTQRRHSQRAISTLSSHTTDSNWTWTGDLFSHIDPATSSTITTITDYSTISKYSMFCQDWPACDKQLVRSAAEAMAMPSTPITTTILEPPPYSTNTANTTTTTTSASSSSTSVPATTSLDSASSSVDSTLSSNDNDSSSRRVEQIVERLQLLISSSSTSSSTSSTFSTIVACLLDDLFSLAATIKKEQDRQKIYQLALSMCDKSTAARVWTARCQLDGWGTELQPRLGFTTLCTLAESNCWEAYYPLALCYSDGVPKHRLSAPDVTMDGAVATADVTTIPPPLTSEPSAVINDHSGISNQSSFASSSLSSSASSASLDRLEIQPIDKQQAWRWLHMAAQLEVKSPDDPRTMVKARAQYKIGTIFFDGDAYTAADHDKALSWFIQSADNRNKYAQFIVGFHYEQGIIVSKNASMAKNYYLSSAQQDSPDAQAALGILLVDDRQFDTGLKWLHDAARMKNTRALVKLGTMHECGQGIAKDEHQALLYYKAACEQNDPSAHYLLGLHYRLGTLGLSQHLIQAGKHFTRSARLGFAPAQRLLGLMYMQGMLLGAATTSTPTTTATSETNRNEDQLQRKAEKTALLWFRRAASQGDVRAFGLVGACYQYGRGVTTNYDVAKEYYRKATRLAGPFQGVAQIALAQLLHQMGNHTEAITWFNRASTSATPSNIDDANDDQAAAAAAVVPPSGRSPSRTARLMLARYYLHGWPGVVKDGKKAFAMLTDLANESQHDAHAHYWLAACYEEGIEGTCTPDLKLAFDHYLLAAKTGDTDAEFQVALMLSNGQGIPRDRKSAFHWYKKAADKNHKTALYSLGLFYAKGLEGKPKDLLRARICFEKAARFGVAPAMTSYATLCRVASLQSGPQQQEQREQAIYWYQKAAATGDVVAQRELGLIYDAGLGVPRNHETAFEYFQQASSSNDAQATLLLGSYYQNGMAVEKDLEKSIELYLKADRLGASVAPFAAAQVYHSLNQFEEAYAHYKKSADDRRLAHNRIGRTSKLMVARYILSYVPMESDTNPTIPPSGTLTKEDAFSILYSLATNDHFEPSFYWLADCYGTGNGVQKNLMEALPWYHKAADELKDVEAMMKLASIYEQLGEQSTQSFHYYQLAADMGHAAGQHQLGMAYWRGSLDTVINLGDAVVWLTRSAAQKYAASHWALGQMALENGDQDVAIEWWRRSIDLGYTPAMRALARLLLQNTEAMHESDNNSNNNDTDHYQQHEETNADLDRAMELLTEAVENGDTDSLVYLGRLHQIKAVHSTSNASDVSSYNQSLRHGTSSASDLTTTTTTPQNQPSSRDSGVCQDNDSYMADGGDQDLDDDEEVEFVRQKQLQEQELATRCFEQAAAMGNVDSMFLAAESWHSQQQYAAALEYYERAAQHGHLLSRVMRARYRLAGLGGMESDPSLGYQELLDCAVQNQCVDAYNSLGQCNELGLGTTQDDQAALDWYLRSADQTQDSEAMFRIGKLYAQGRVPTPDGQHKDVEALKWYKFASETRNHTQAHYEIGLYLARGITTTTTSSSSSISSSSASLPRLASPRSSSSLSSSSSSSSTVLISADREAAKAHFQHASEQGDMNAMYELGQLLLMDEDVTTTTTAVATLDMNDRRVGLDWLLNAAQMNQRDALRELGKMYHSGKSYGNSDDDDSLMVEQNSALAYDYFIRSANQGDKTAMLFVGIYYEHGIHVHLDFSLARQWYEMAARNDWWLAELALAQLLHQQVDSREEAYRYFTLAHQHAPESQRQPATIMLARYHIRGWGGVSVQLEQAASQLITIAENENQVKVYLEVAQCYEFGIGVDQDVTKAFEWYDRVVQHHHHPGDASSQALDEEDREDLAEAVFRLAEFHRRGWAVPKDQQKANQLYQLAVQKGSKEAQEYLTHQQGQASSSS